MTRRRDRGFALLIVLWTLALLALLGTHMVAQGRGDAQLARNQIDAAILEADTDAAVQQAIFHMMQPAGQRWLPDEETHLVREGSSIVSVRLVDEAGKVNIDIASPDLLRALLLQVGAPPATAARVAAAIVDWRTAGTQPGPLGAKAPQYLAAGRDYGPPGDNFRSVDELGLVLGMTPDLLARVRPHVTIYSDADPDGSTSDPVVLAALGNPQPSAPAGPTSLEVASVIAIAHGRNHGAFAEQVVVRLDGAAGGHPFDILSLQRNVSVLAIAPGS